MKENKYLKWIDKNIKNLKEKRIVLNGATGGIGKEVAFYLSYLKNNLIFLVRNINEGEKLKEEFETKFSNHIEVIYFDFLDKCSLDNSLNKLSKYNDIYAFINIGGIYHQKEEYISNIEKTYIVNYFNSVYFIEKYIAYFPSSKIVDVSSITYSSKKIKKKDLSSLSNPDAYINYLNSYKNKTSRYALSKRLKMECLLFIKDIHNINLIFTHPGISKTNLFSKKNNAYPSWFYLFVPKLMELVFMSPKKASLPMILALEIDKIKEGYWVGPKGFASSYGYPSIYKLKKDLFNKKLNKRVYELTKEINERL